MNSFLEEFMREEKVANILDLEIVCLYLEMEGKGYPPYCVNPEKTCKYIFVYGSNKYCKREL